MNQNLVCKTFTAKEIIEMVDRFKSELQAKVVYEGKLIKITTATKELQIEEAGKGFEVISFHERVK